jgi:dGTPase
MDTMGPSIFRNLAADYKHDLIAVEGNAQGFRIIAQTENHLFDGGLQLTYATLGTFHKYPWSSRKGVKKFGSFLSEEPILSKLGETLGLVQTAPDCWCRHPLAHLVEAADDICYSIIDLEDAVELRILSFDKVAKFFLESFDKREKAIIRSGFSSENSDRTNLAHLRRFVFDKAISGAIEAYMSAYHEIMEGRYDGNIFDLLNPNDPRMRLVFGAKQIGLMEVYTDTKKIEMEIGCYATFDIILTELCSAALNQAEVLRDGPGEAALSWKSKQVLRLLGDHAPTKGNAPADGWSSYQCLRRVIDFVTGMTDNYAVYVSRQLQGLGFSGVQRP